MVVIAYYYSARVLCAKFVRPTRGMCTVPTWDHRDGVSSTKGQHATSVRHSDRVRRILAGDIPKFWRERWFIDAYLLLVLDFAALSPSTAFNTEP
jgi:hypothetical protein